MKNLSIEEKAKAYDDALERAKEYHDVDKDNTMRVRARGVMEYLFPELKECKDEKIRKWIIRVLKSLNSTAIQIDDAYEMMLPAIDWLKKQDTQIIKEALRTEYEKGRADAIAEFEKQGEQKQIATQELKPKFKVGDWIISDKAHKDYRICKIIEVSDGNYKIDSIHGYIGYYNFKVIDSMYRLWTIEDAKDGDVLAGHESYVIFKEIESLNIKCYCTYHYIGFYPNFYVDTLQNKTSYYPAIKEQRDALMKVMTNAGYEWDAEKKELKKIEQKTR